MNKTMRTITIVFLILGTLALIGGAIFAGIGRPGAARLMSSRNWQNFSQTGSERHSRGLQDGMPPFLHRGFLSLPFWLMGGGLSFLITGVVLMILNKKIVNALDETPQKAETTISTPKKASQSKKSAEKKPVSKA